MFNFWPSVDLLTFWRLDNHTTLCYFSLTNYSTLNNWFIYPCHCLAKKIVHEFTWRNELISWSHAFNTPKWNLFWYKFLTLYIGEVMLLVVSMFNSISSIFSTAWKRSWIYLLCLKCILVKRFWEFTTKRNNFHCCFVQKMLLNVWTTKMTQWKLQ